MFNHYHNQSYNSLNMNNDNFSVAASFSLNRKDDEGIISSIVKNKSFKNLCDNHDVYLEGINL